MAAGESGLVGQAHNQPTGPNVPTTLYHFTSVDRVDSIITDKAFRAGHLEIPKRGRSTAPVVSMTANPDPRGLMGKSLWSRAPLSGDVLTQFVRDNPDADIPPGPGTDEVMLTLEIPDDDLNLYALDFSSCAALGFTSQANVDDFMALGGGVPGEWFVYYGDMPSDYIVACQVRINGNYVSCKHARV